MTTRRYIRRCRLQVFHQGQRIVTVEDAMRIAFVIRKDSNQATQTSNVSIYNLAPPTASVIHLQGDSVRLEAGYEGNPLGLLFEGEILPDRINHDRTALERITTIGLGNAHAARTMTIFSRSYDRTTVRQIAQDIVAELGIPLDANSLALLPTDTVADWSFAGLAEDALTELLEPRGIRWYIVDCEMRFANAEQAAIPAVFVLSEQTGMIGTPSPTDTGVRAKMVLNPDVELDQLVRVRSQYLNGQYAVTSVVHRGDTWEGEWATEIQATSMGA